MTAAGVVQPTRVGSRVAPWLLVGAVVAGGWVLLALAHLRHDGWMHASGLAVGIGGWLLMTAAMMLPTAVPMLSTLGSVLAGRTPTVWWGFLAGYLSVWGLVGVVASVLQYLLGHQQWWGSAGARSYTAAAALAVAGLYQFSGLKAACLRACTNPMQWLLRHWRDGGRGALAMGARHGIDCLGCCWALMGLALIGGSAAFAVMALTAVLMAIEKVPAIGARASAPIGVGLMVLAVLAALTATGGSADHHRIEGGESHGIVVTVR